MKNYTPGWDTRDSTPFFCFKDLMVSQGTNLDSGCRATVAVLRIEPVKRTAKPGSRPCGPSAAYAGLSTLVSLKTGAIKSLRPARTPIGWRRHRLSAPRC